MLQIAYKRSIASNKLKLFVGSVPEILQDMANHLLASLDGTTVNITSNMTIIHHQFGETWALNRRYWIFQYESFVQEILQDMADGVDYKVSNEATFDSPEEEEKARKVKTNKNFT